MSLQTIINGEWQEVSIHEKMETIAGLRNYYHFNPINRHKYPNPEECFVESVASEILERMVDTGKSPEDFEDVVDLIFNETFEKFLPKKGR